MTLILVKNSVFSCRARSPDGSDTSLMILALFAHGLIEYNFGDSELLILLAIMMGIVGVGAEKTCVIDPGA